MIRKQSRILRQAGVAFAAAFFLASCFFLTFCSDSGKRLKNAPEEEKPVAVQAYLNHAPGVKYMGRESCLPCHQDIHDDFEHTGKGRSFYLPSRQNIIEDFSPGKATVYDRYTDLGYRAFWRGDAMMIAEFRLKGRDTIHYREEKVNYVIGSGNQTRSYLFEQNGYFYEMPLTWYVGKKIWDLSPGYEKGSNTGFSRTVGQQCMECHNSNNDFVKFSVNRFTTVGSGISCEKCHGPGEAHIDAMKAGKAVDVKQAIDYTIVNPAKLPVQLQFDVCRQCHLEGITVPKAGKDIFDYRPGMALADFYDVFLPVAQNQSEFGFASHSERLQQSPCFIQSGQTLTCNTCHSPHKTLEQVGLNFYNQQCQSCHKPATFDENHKTLKIKDQNCVNCHMPKSGTTDIPHVSSTDHFIRVVKEKEKQAEAPKAQLVTFKSFTAEQNVDDHDRAHVLANMIYFEQNERNPAYLQRVAKYIGELELDNQVKFAYLNDMSLPAAAANLQPGQVQQPYTAFYIGELKARAGQQNLPWLERSVALAPDNLEFMQALADAYNKAQQPQQAEKWFKTILARQPYYKRALVNYGFMKMMQGNFDEALRLTEQAIKADPNYTLAYENRVNIYLQQGNYQKGLQLIQDLIRMYPQNRQYIELRQRVEQAMRES